MTRKVKVAGTAVAPGQSVTLHARTADDSDKEAFSDPIAHVDVDALGEIEVDADLTGDYWLVWTEQHAVALAIGPATPADMIERPTHESTVDPHVPAEQQDATTREGAPGEPTDHYPADAGGDHHPDAGDPGIEPETDPGSDTPPPSEETVPEGTATTADV